MTTEVLDIVSEIGVSGTPDIKIPDGINVEGLKKSLGLTELQFVTLPIGKVGVTSRNGKKYNRKAIESLVNQVNTIRPEGQWGHVDPAKAGFSYTPPAIKWIAAVLEGDTAWGKALLLTEDARRHIEVARDTQSKVGTSVWGDNVVYEKMGGVDDYRLCTIDLANSQRVGVPDTSAHPHVTTEQEKGKMETDKDKKDDNGHVTEIEELQEENKGLKATIKPLKKSFNTIMEILDVDKVEDVEAAVEAIIEERDSLRSENVILLETEIGAQVDKLIALEQYRPLVKKLVKSEKPRTRKEVAEKVKLVTESEEVKDLLKDAVAETAGGTQKRPGTKTPDNDAWKAHVHIPSLEEDEKEKE